jgi:hypothetical protein
MSERTNEPANEEEERNNIASYVEKATKVVALIQECIEIGNQLKRKSATIAIQEALRKKRTEEYRDSFVFDAMFDMFREFSLPRAHVTSAFEKSAAAIS